MDGEEWSMKLTKEHNGRESVGQPEADIFLGIGHADLADEGADVDHHIEVQVTIPRIDE